MTKTEKARSVVDALKRCARGETFSDCAKDCRYACRGRQCQAVLMRDAADMIRELESKIDEYNND